MPVKANYIGTGREPWSSGYGRKLIIRRLWVRTLVPYTGWTFFTFICCNYWTVCLKRPKINEKRGRGRTFLKNNTIQPIWLLIVILMEQFSIRLCVSKIVYLFHSQVEGDDKSSPPLPFFSSVRIGCGTSSWWALCPSSCPRRWCSLRICATLRHRPVPSRSPSR